MLHCTSFRTSWSSRHVELDVPPFHFCSIGKATRKVDWWRNSVVDISAICSCLLVTSACVMEWKPQSSLIEPWSSWIGICPPMVDVFCAVWELHFLQMCSAFWEFPENEPIYRLARFLGILENAALSGNPQMAQCFLGILCWLSAFWGSSVDSALSGKLRSSHIACLPR